MHKTASQCVLLADFNAGNLAGYLRNEPSTPRIEVEVAPFGQITPLLVDAAAAIWQAHPDFAVVWTQPQRVIESFGRHLAHQPVPWAQLESEVDAFADALRQAATRLKFLLVPVWALPPGERGAGLLEWRLDRGCAHALAQMNLRLAEQLRSVSNVYLLDTSRWLAAGGLNAFNAKLWYLAKVPFSNEVFQEAARDIAAAAQALAGGTKKLIVLDLDDTLWGGIVGDVGWKQLRLGGHDPVGEAYVDFQKALKALTHRGLLLGVASKNDEAVALEAIERHPEMMLRRKDFAGWRINWNDKAQNILDLVAELNLGAQSVVFIDDNPVERARVREALPEVFVPEWPRDPMLYAGALRALRCFDTPTISAEDLARGEHYSVERQRTEARQQANSPEEWLKTLQMVVTVKPLDEADLPRAAQLLNKTNQMNLATRRLTDTELWAWTQQSGRTLWTVRVADRFGDSGLTGIISLEVAASVGRIVDFLLSCRVMGRKVEETMLHVAVAYARKLGLAEVVAEFLPTEKNKPCLEFWQKSGFACTPGPTIFRWNVTQPYPAPDAVRLA